MHPEDFYFKVAEATAVVFTSVFAYLRYLRENPFRPRIQFDLKCNFLGPQNEKYLASLTIYAENKGNAEHRFKTISVEICGIKKNAQLEGLKDVFDGQIVQFTEPIIMIENLVPEREEYYFVRPSVNQAFNYALSIPSDIRFIKIEATFSYERGHDKHYAQRIYEVNEE